ncbi:MAG: hypothetical protein ACR2IF_11165 [Terriglobales bacterium]
MSAILKSLGLALLGTALFFSFFMMLIMLALVIVAGLKHSVIVTPVPLLRYAGLPLSVVVFAIVFAVGMRRFTRPS